MKGCYIYSTDRETQEYFKNKILFDSKKNGLYADISDGTSLNIDN